MDQLTIIARDVPPVGGARIASALVYKRNILAIGVCQYKSHPLQMQFSSNPEAKFLHSEIACIRNAKRVGVSADIFKNSTLYICRQKMKQKNIVENGRILQTKKWTSGLACPCKGCAAAIVAFGIGEVIYSLDNSGFQIYN